MIPEHTMWAIPILFFIWDRLILINEDQCVLVENNFWRIKIIYSAVPYTWKKKDLYLCNPFVPYGAVYVVKIVSAGSNEVASKLAIHKPALIDRVIAIGTTLNFVFLGPILTNYVNLNLTIQIVLFFHLFFLLIASAVYRPQKNKLSAYFLGMFEFFVCPGYLMNFVMRNQYISSVDYQVSLDQLVEVTSAEEVEELKIKLDVRVGHSNEQ